VAFDRAQSIYERGCRFKDCGIELHGSRSFDLKKNFRNTREILEAARPLLYGIERERQRRNRARTDKLLRPEESSRRGARPRSIQTRRGQEFQALAADVSRLIGEQGVPPQNIAVLCYPNKNIESAVRALGGAGVWNQKHAADSRIRLTDPSVKVLPVKSAKGLEFPVVYLLASGRWYHPPAGLGRDEERATWLSELRRVFYMAMTRAMSDLVLVHDRDDPVAFIRHL